MPNAHSSREGWLRSPMFDLHEPSAPPRRSLSRFAYITKWMLAVTIGLGTLADPQLASAESLAEAPDDSTKELLRRGFAASKKGDLEGAREAFAAAWERRKHFAVALSLAEVETSLGRFVEAAGHWQYVVRHLPDDLTEKRSFAEVRLAECKTRIGTLTLRVTPDGSAIHVDGARAAESPLNRELYLPPGDHTFYAEKIGQRSATRTVRLAAGSRLSLDLAVPPGPPARASVAPSRSSTASSRTSSHTASDGQSSAGSFRTPVLIGGAVLTLASAAVGTVFVWKSNGASDDAQGALEQAVAESNPGVAPSAACGVQARPRACAVAMEKLRDKDEFRDMALSAFVATGAFAAGTAAAYLVWAEPAKSRHSSSSTPAFLSPVVGPSFGGAVVGGRF